MADPKVPASKEEAAAARQALAKYDVTRLEAAKAVLAGEKIAAAVAEVKALLEGGLPAGSSIAANLPRLESWVVEVSANLDADLDSFGRIADPEAAAAADEERRAAGAPAGAGSRARPVPMLPVDSKPAT